VDDTGIKFSPMIPPVPDGEHACVFDEVIIEDGDYEEGDPLQPGMKVLKPCTCGETPMDHMELLYNHFDEAQRALKQVEPSRPLYHWSPTSRRKQIIRYGLRPYMRPNTTMGEDWGHKAPVVCFADTPSWAWALSGAMRWTPTGEWDLWQTFLEDLIDPVILASDERPSGIYEVRTEFRVYKRFLWLVGTRTK
jgi:hypothetical protein